LVDYIAMDVKSCRDDYSKVAGVEVDVSKIEESMKIVYDFGKRENEPRTSTDEHGLEKKYEFRTTVVGRLHSVEKIVSMGKWMNEVCGGKPRSIFLQGFKSGQEMIDSDFKKEKDVGEEFLLELKDSVEGLFGLVDIRV